MVVPKDTLLPPPHELQTIPLLSASPEEKRERRLSRGGTPYEFVTLQPPSQPANRMHAARYTPPSRHEDPSRRTLMIPQSYIVHNHSGQDSIDAWATPKTIAEGAPRRPPLLNQVHPTHSDDADLEDMDGIPLTDQGKSSPFANNHRLKVENPAYKKIAAEKARKKRKRHHMDCLGILFLFLMILGSLSAYGYALYKSKFWLRDQSEVTFKLPGWSHPLIVTVIMTEIILWVGFVARCILSATRMIEDEETPLLVSKRPLPDTIRDVPLDSWIMLTGMWIGIFLAALDATMVATLQTTIASEFQQNNKSAWLGTSYLLSVAATQGLYGRISDIVGRKYAALFSITMFSIGTALCGIATSMEMIIIGRAIAGLGGGGLTTLSSIVCSDLVSLRQRGTFQGLANCLFGAGAALGGPLGGVMTEKYGFRFAFLVQLPFCLVSLVIIIWKVNIPLPFAETTAREKLRQIDFLGAIVLVTAVSLLVGASSFGGNLLPWSDKRVIGALVASIMGLFIFVYVEAKVARTPVLPIDLVFRRTPGFAALVNFFAAAASFGFLYSVPIYSQAVLGQTSKRAGLNLLPNAVAIPLGSLLAGWSMAKYERYYKLTLFFTLCFPLSAFSLSTWGRHPPYWRTWFDIFFNGFGTAGSTTTTLLALLSAVQQHELAVATGLSYLARSVGQVVGVTLSQAVLQNLLLKQLTERIADPKLVEAIRTDATVVKTLPKILRKAAVESYNISMHWTFITIGILGTAAFLCATVIQEKKIPRKTGDDP